MTMRFLSAAGTSLLLFAATAVADPAVGTDRARVIAELGPPTSRLAAGERELLTYERGTVLLIGGVVAKSDLMSREAFENLKESREAEAAARRKEAALIAERTAADNRARDILLGAPEWKSAGGADRVTALLRFAEEHPYADVKTELAEAQKRRDAEQAKADRALGLQMQLAASEERRRAAEEKLAAIRAARQAREQEEMDAYDYTVISGGVVRHIRRHPPKTDTPGSGAVLPPSNIGATGAPQRETPDPNANRATSTPGANRETSPNRPSAPAPSRSPSSSDPKP